MKWISLLISFIFAGKATKSLNLKEISMEIYEEALFRSRKPVGLILLGLASVILICAGIIITIIDATRQYDARGFIYPGAMFWSGLALACIFLTSYIFIFTKAWPGWRRHHHREQNPHASHTTPGLDEALSLLIMDYIAERKSRRAAPPPPPPPSSTKEKSH